jgi:hypothetical protein
VLALAVTITALSALAAEELNIAPAMLVADKWLGHVDQGRYDQSWDEAAPFFKESVAKVKWETSLDAARAPLGVAVARKMRSATYATTLPGAPEGEYVVIEYNTTFENRPQSVETVTPMRDKDGTWKVAGYFIR